MNGEIIFVRIRRYRCSSRPASRIMDIRMRVVDNEDLAHVSRSFGFIDTEV